MFFGWNKVSKGFHLASTWLVTLGATLSALWILIANAWMQYPVGMEFNPDTVRNEMVDFWAVATSPVAINKFFHTVLSAWALSAVVVIGVSAWYLLKKRELLFARDSIKVASVVGFIGIVLCIYTGDSSAYNAAKTQPMKFAAMEALYEGGNEIGLIGVGVLTPDKKYDDDKDPFIFKIEIPYMLSFLATRDAKGYVPGINNLIEGGYETSRGTALSMEEKMRRGRLAMQGLEEYRKAKKEGDSETAIQARKQLDDNYSYFGYGYFKSPSDAIPDVSMVFYSFRIMVILGCFFLLFFIVVWIVNRKDKLKDIKWLQWVCLLSIPLVYIVSQSGWIVAEVGRQPWAIQDILPLMSAVSDINTGSVQVTFFVFLAIFTAFLIAEIGIMVHQIKKGPETLEEMKNEDQ